MKLTENKGVINVTEPIKDKNPVGRPLKFKTVEELQTKIDEFFLFCKDEKRPLTIERLCVFLDCDRQTLLNYSTQDEFFATIKKAKNMILASKAEKLQTANNPAGLIFDLKNNHNYVDRIDQNISMESTADIIKKGRERARNMALLSEQNSQ